MSNELKHYGVLGMKWGRRKDRNRSSSKDLNRFGDKINSSSRLVNDSKNIHSIIKKRRDRKHPEPDIDLSGFSDKELRQKINRMNMEREYKKLSSQNISTGRSKVDDILDNAGDALAVAGSIVSIAATIKYLRGN